MPYPIAYEEVAQDIEYHEEVAVLYKEAENYLYSFDWCKKIRSCRLYLNLGSKLCIYLFQIDNSASVEDNILWVVVGDIPPMYLDTYGAKSIREVLDNYVTLATDWIECIKLKGNIEECYPFNTQPTIQMASLLERKVTFIKNSIIKNVDDISLEAV